MQNTFSNCMYDPYVDTVGIRMLETQCTEPQINTVTNCVPAGYDVSDAATGQCSLSTGVHDNVFQAW